jgi:hypothetical protein
MKIQMIFWLLIVAVINNFNGNQNINMNENVDENYLIDYGVK